jgi:hypothetical protein
MRARFLTPRPERRSRWSMVGMVVAIAHRARHVAEWLMVGASGWSGLAPTSIDGADAGQRHALLPILAPMQSLAAPSPVVARQRWRTRSVCRMGDGRGQAMGSWCAARHSAQGGRYAASGDLPLGLAAFGGLDGALLLRRPAYRTNSQKHAN